MEPSRDRILKVLQSFSLDDTEPENNEPNEGALTSAHRLWDYVVMDLLPKDYEDEDMQVDFGFTHLPSIMEKQRLLGLYKGLALMGYSPEDLHKWQVERSLVTNIKKAFSNLPEENRGGYYPWFLKCTHILDNPMTVDEAGGEISTGVLEEARTYLDKKDQSIQTPADLKPQAKADSLFFLGVLYMGVPSPNMPVWYDFGFCTCVKDSEETALMRIYRKLLLGDIHFEGVSTLRGQLGSSDLTKQQREQRNRAFTEFWQAYESRSLMALMDSKGLKTERSKLPYLERFLCDRPRHSVWSLRQYLEVDDPKNFCPTPAVRFDYGFMNCRNDEETRALMEIYKKLLGKITPLELHEACVTKTVFECAQKFGLMNEGHRRLMSKEVRGGLFGL
ncbi:hypothetical protein FQN52_001141 [Onygenales sp. PD_12]|nr:hypothetical protein FQN53_006621 [Emmonsiellopsis sp. PD_33]KAK2793555.1 hypothetical protein FQN52_001141 [Onygenales sp. PD_12]